MNPSAIEPPGAEEETDPLCYYLRHRLAHPLPKGWTHQFGLLEEPPPDLAIEWPARAFLRFRTPRWSGELRVCALVFEASALGIDILDQSGDGLTAWELSELLFTLLGIEVDPHSLEKELSSFKSEEPDESSDTKPAGEDGWKLSILFPYPPAGEVHPDEKGSASSPESKNRNPI